MDANDEFMLVCRYHQFGKGFARDGAVPRIRLTRKLALTMNGVDVSRLSVGDIIELPDHQAQMMVECGWADRVPEPSSLPDLSVASSSERNLIN